MYCFYRKQYPFFIILQLMKYISFKKKSPSAKAKELGIVSLPLLDGFRTFFKEGVQNQGGKGGIGGNLILQKYWH